MKVPSGIPGLEVEAAAPTGVPHVPSILRRKDPSTIFPAVVRTIISAALIVELNRTTCNVITVITSWHRNLFRIRPHEGVPKRLGLSVRAAAPTDLVHTASVRGQNNPPTIVPANVHYFVAANAALVGRALLNSIYGASETASIVSYVIGAVEVSPQETVVSSHGPMKTAITIRPVKFPRPRALLGHVASFIEAARLTIESTR